MPNPQAQAKPPAATGHTARISVAGVPVDVVSNSRDVVAAARRRFVRRASRDAAICRLDVHVRSATPGVIAGADVRWRFPDDDHALVTAAGLEATLDVASGRADVRVTRRFLASAAQFRRTVLEGMVFVLLTRRDRHPVHAAILRNGASALLLHGPSGVGKSTLAYAASRAGMQVLSDDVARIQLDPELRVWGDGPVPRVYLLPDARRDYPELRRLEPEPLFAGGERKLSVALASRGALSLRTPYSRTARVCLLTRHDGPAAMREATPHEIREALLHNPEAVFDRAPAQRRAVAIALSARGGWHLTLSSSAADAVPLLAMMLSRTESARTRRL